MRSTTSTTPLSPLWRVVPYSQDGRARAAKGEQFDVHDSHVDVHVWWMVKLQSFKVGYSFQKKKKSLFFVSFSISERYGWNPYMFYFFSLFIEDYILRQQNWKFPCILLRSSPQNVLDAKYRFIVLPTCLHKYFTISQDYSAPWRLDVIFFPFPLFSCFPLPLRFPPNCYTPGYTTTSVQSRIAVEYFHPPDSPEKKICIQMPPINDVDHSGPSTPSPSFSIYLNWLVIQLLTDRLNKHREKVNDKC